jgi:signal transduction histidine kinase
MRIRAPRPSASAAPAIKVAVAATIVVACLYVAVVGLLAAVVVHRLAAETDSRLATHLAELERQPSRLSPGQVYGDADDALVYVWRISGSGAVTSSSAGAPTLPRSLATRVDGFPRSAQLGTAEFRLDLASLPDGSRLLVAQSLAQERHVRHLLLLAALIVSPVLIGGVFVGALVIGRRASRPIEHARKRQLEFIADASHELRTPLTVIDAEVSLALNADRSALAYRESLERVAGETDRLRTIVEDLLWLARFDSQPPPPNEELVDLPTLVSRCAQRFVPVAGVRGVELRVQPTTESEALIAAPPDWIDRLVGVLLDNATRYVAHGGCVDVEVATRPGHVVLVVSDDGPGIPVDERARLFDRFHRLDTAAGQTGAGLGLAIADAVVRSTKGRWDVGRSPTGGARMSVAWPRVAVGRRLPSDGHPAAQEELSTD